MNKPINLFSWLYDVNLDPNGIRFVLFGLWTFHHLDIANIKSIAEISSVSPGAWNAYNFKNRFLGRSFLIATRLGWFSRKMLVTPKDPDAFLAWAKMKKLYIPTS
ncbi:MAG: hypothetical protein V4495_11030 [Pseudomonadota bacterium]